MRRTSSSLFSNLSKSHSTPRHLSTYLFSLSSSPDPCHPFPTRPQPTTSATTHGLLFHNPCNKTPFPKYSYRNIETLPEKSPPLSRRQQKLEEIADLEEAFESATTTEEILSTFKALEASSGGRDDVKLGLACLKVGQHLDSIGSEDHEKTVAFARQALRILEKEGEQSIMAVMALHLMGSVSYNMQRFNDSLGYLNKANRILGKIGEDGSDEFDIKPVSHAVQLQLANTKTAMGRREEALVNLRNCLELKESMFEPDSREVGVAYRDLAEAYVAVLDFKEALQLCLKALEIHMNHLGHNSVEVAHDRRLLGVIYTGLEEYQKALEQNQLSQKVMKNWGLDSDLLNAEIEAANMQIALGKYDEAISTLKGVVQQTDKESQTRALVFISMAKALTTKEKFVDAKRCLEISCSILEKKEHASPGDVADGYADMAELYETMNEFETAITLLKRAVSMFEKLPQEQYAEANASARIGWLLLLTGKVREGIPYMESAAERLKESFGPKHYAVGYIYNNLGAAYLELERPQSAAQMFALAKDIMDVSLGRHHADSIGACQNLANAYDAMLNYDLALEFQQRVIDAWRGHGPSAEEKLQEAKRRLEEMEKKVTARVLDAWECRKDNHEESAYCHEEPKARAHGSSPDHVKAESLHHRD